MTPSGPKRRPPLEDLRTFDSAKARKPEDSSGTALAGTAAAAAWPAMPVVIPRALGGWKTVSLAVLVGAAVAGVAVRVHVHRTAARSAATQGVPSKQAADATGAADEVRPVSGSSSAWTPAAVLKRWKIPTFRVPPSAVPPGGVAPAGDPFAGLAPLPTAAEFIARAAEQRRQHHPREALELYTRALEFGMPMDALLGEADVYLADLNEPKSAFGYYKKASKNATAGKRNGSELSAAERIVDERAQWGMVGSLRALGNADQEAAFLERFLHWHADSALAPQARERLAALGPPPAVEQP